MNSPEHYLGYSTATKLLSEDVGSEFAKFLTAVYMVTPHEDKDPIMWRYEYHSDRPSAASKITYGNNGKVLSRKTALYWSDVKKTDAATFFGGHLLPLFPKDKVLIMQDEYMCMLCALVFADCICVALGEDNLTKKHLQVLNDREIILLPDIMAIEYWQRLGKPTLDILAKSNPYLFLLKNFDLEHSDIIKNKYKLVENAVRAESFEYIFGMWGSKSESELYRDISFLTS